MQIYMPNIVEDVEALFYIRFLEYFVTNSYQHIVHKNIFFVVSCQKISTDVALNALLDNSIIQLNKKVMPFLHIHYFRVILLV
jgi:hypothetical protein